MTPSRTYFLTGATGLVGSYLLTILLRHNHKIFVLARGDGQNSAYDRVFSRISFWNKKLLKTAKTKVIVLEGDITDRSLGLSTNTLRTLQNSVEEVFHCAAETKFNADIELLRNVNVTGTVNVLNQCLAWTRKGKLIKVNYISTAYICGNSKKVLREKDCSIGQSFTTTYEKSKYEAELNIAKFRHNGLWIDIYRPPAIAGESKTGKIYSFDQAIYQALKIVNLKLIDEFPINCNATINIVYVDELCTSIYILSMHRDKLNATYHTFSNNHLSCRKLINFAHHYFFNSNARFSTESNFLKKASFSQKKLVEHNLFFIYKRKLNSLRTINLLKPFKFKFSDYNTLFYSKLLKYAVKKGFFKLSNYEI